MVFKILCILVLLMKVASALKGLSSNGFYRHLQKYNLSEQSNLLKKIQKELINLIITTNFCQIIGKILLYHRYNVVCVRPCIDFRCKWVYIYCWGTVAATSVSVVEVIY